MFKRLQERVARRHMKRTMVATAATGNGMHVQVWPLMESDHTQLGTAIQTWLWAQLPDTATPHGLSGYGITLMWVQMQGETRTWLGDHSIPTFQRLDAAASLDTLPQVVQQFNLPPHATHLEVYLISFGDLVKPAFAD